MIVLDLCAGTGSATRAFMDRGHDVDTLDIQGGHTFNMDVRKFRPWKKYDIIWASPPCTEFSLADWKKGKCKDRNPDLSIVYVCMDICKTAPYWIMENPRACLRYFIGKPAITVCYNDYGAKIKKYTDLWGNPPFFWSTSKRQKIIKWEQTMKDHKGNWFRYKDAAAVRAEVPYGLSLAICKALEGVIDRGDFRCIK